MIPKEKEEQVLSHFKQTTDVFWRDGSWRNFSDLDDLSILMFYFYNFAYYNKKQNKFLLYNYFYNNFHSNVPKRNEYAFEHFNYFHLNNFVRLLKDFEYLSVEITELHSYLEDLTIEVEDIEKKITCNTCGGTGDFESWGNNRYIWDDCSVCDGAGGYMDTISFLTEQSTVALEELSSLILPLLEKIRLILCIEALNNNSYEVKDKVYPEYTVLKSIRNF